MEDEMASGEEVSLYETQIRYLEEQLDSCQHKQVQKVKEYERPTFQLAGLQEDVKIQSAHLKRVLIAKERRVAELLDQLEKERRDAIYLRGSLRLQHSSKMQELRELMDGLDSESDKQVERLEAQTKDLIQVECALESLTMQLEIQQKEHTAAVNIMMKEELLERDRKTEPPSVDTTVMLQTAEKLKKNRDERKKRLQQLNFLKREAGHLQEDIDALRVRVRDLHSEEDEVKKDFRKIIQQKSTHKKEVDEVSQKCKQLKVELKDRTLTNQRTLTETEALRLESF